jgi:hypothetical protein
MVKKPVTEETITNPVTDEKENNTDVPLVEPQLMVASATVEAPEAPKLFKVEVVIGTLMFEQGTFQRGAILNVNEDEYRRTKDFVKLVP